jgi:glycosyltransferase involved in cell wall biosynthesis
MHIAFLTSEYPHPKLNNTGGLGTSIKNLAIELQKNHVKVSVFVYGQNKDEVFKEDEITIYKIAHRSFKVLGWYLHRKYLQKYINKVIFETKIDLLEATDWTGITAFMKFRVPLLIRLNGSDGYFCALDNRKQKLKNYIFEKKALLGADKVVSVSTFTAKKTNQVFGIQKCNTVIHNGINTDDFMPFPEQINAGEILYFGTIIRKKGVLELAHAFNILIASKPDASLLLLGKDVIDVFENKSTLELFFNILSDQAKKKVRYLPEVHYSKVAQIIAKANIVTLPSFAEAFPMTWLEAMAMEKALVTSNIGWANEMMIDGETGFTVTPEDHVSYANKMELLLKDAILATQLGKNARQRVLQKFDSKLIAKQNIEFYKSLIK